MGQEPVGTSKVLPPCVGLVPLLWSGSLDELRVDEILECLRSHGSYAVNGFMDPEGIVIYHSASNTCFKKDPSQRWVTQITGEATNY